MKSNVLIIEDKQSHFEIIESVLSQKFNYFPSTNKDIKTIQDNSFLNDYAFVKSKFLTLIASNQEKDNEALKNEYFKNRNKVFDSIIKQFKYDSIKYTFYIVDIELKQKQNDNLGFDFIKYLEENSLNAESKTIILSNASLPPGIVDDETFNERYKFISKGEDNWKMELSEYIFSLESSSYSNDENKSDSNPFPKFSETSRSNKIRFYLDKYFQIFFLVLIISCVFLAVKNMIWNDFNLSSLFENNANNVTQNDINHDDNYITNKSDSITQYYKNNIYSIESKKDKDLVLLKFAEHIFLYLIPLFIVFGFYSYYYFEFRRILLKLPLSPADSINSKATISITKTLFLSSILSYSIIKIIEKIFIEDNLKILNIAAYGVFLMILMIYLLLTHNSNKH
ncbi:MAG: hypothetical protein ACKVQV_06145 [Bacteroidia bacterium]